MFRFFSPTFFTGGPWAIHQAAKRMNELGGNASIIYASADTIYPGCEAMQVLDGTLTIQNYRPSSLRMRNERRRKRFRDSIDARLLAMNLPYSSEASVDDHFVLSESTPLIAETLLQLGCRNVYLWWLGVDNFPLHSLHQLNTLRTLRGCENLCQSAYARDFVTRLGMPRISMLSDFTDYSVDDVSQRPLDKRKVDVAYLPSKAQGAEPVLADLRQHFEVVALQNMTPAQIKQTLCDSRIFLDFGHHPGKDRVPREAAMCGAIPLVRKAGAAAYPEDVPLPEALLVETNDFFDPREIVARVSRTLQAAATFAPTLEEYQKKIMAERDIFDAELGAMITKADGDSKKP